MLQFDRDVDKITLRPAAIIYNSTVPPPIQQGVTNFFDNVLVITTFPNDILQGKFRYAAIDIWRFLLNTTLGIGGIFDPASAAGLPKHYQDFGLTFSYWNHGKQTEYLVLPFIGPSTVSDAVGKIGDFGTSPWLYVKPTWVGWAAVGLAWTNWRSQLLPADKLVDQAFDPYIFIKEAYMQRRNKYIQENALGDYDPNRTVVGLVLDNNAVSTSTNISTDTVVTTALDEESKISVSDDVKKKTVHQRHKKTKQ
jgi:phospholipid-binding lipoprotein MlaA